MDDKIIDINQRKVAAYVKSIRPPIEIRNQVDVGYRYNKGIIEIYERRPRWNNDMVYDNFSFAKIRFIKKHKIWKLYWMRASEKWELYEPFPESKNLDAILECIEQDSYGCFMG